MGWEDPDSNPMADMQEYIAQVSDAAYRSVLAERERLLYECLWRYDPPEGLLRMEQIYQDPPAMTLDDDGVLRPFRGYSVASRWDPGQ